MERLSRAHVYVVGEPLPFQDEVCRAMRRARELSGLGLAEFASELAAAAGAHVTPVLVEEWETGQRLVTDARLYFAACRVADQPQSAVAGEMELVPTIYELQRSLAALHAKVGDSL